MAESEIHRKIDVTEAAVGFSSTLNELPAGDIAWSDPLTTLEDCDFAEFTMQIVGGSTSPEGSIQYYVARDTGTLTVADHHIDLTKAGKEGTANDIKDIIADCGAPVFNVPVLTAVASIAFQHSFRVWYPGDSINLLCYNNTDEAFASSGNSAYVRGWLPASQ